MFSSHLSPGSLLKLNRSCSCCYFEYELFALGQDAS